MSKRLDQMDQPTDLEDGDLLYCLRGNVDLAVSLGALMNRLAGHAMPIQNLPDSSVDLTPDHVNKYNRLTYTGAKTITIKADADELIATKSQINIRAIGTGDLTLSPAVGVTVNLPADGTLVLAQGMYVTLVKVGADEWDLLGYTVLAE